MRHRTLVEDVFSGLDVGIVVLDEHDRLVWINDAAKLVFQIKRVAERTARAQLLEKLPKETVEALASPGYVELPSGRWIDHRIQKISSGPYVGGLMELFYDVTSLRRSVQDKEMLLREVHHRVRNNLQVVSSLLRLEGDRLEADAVDLFIEESIDRIRSMALVHEMLYTTGGLTEIDLGAYVRKLTEQMRAAHEGETAHLDVAVLSDRVHVDLDRAVHIGLILTELLSNALRHAFLGRDSGRVRVCVEQKDDGLHVSVEDDGLGLPAGFALENTRSLGFQLVQAVSQQIGATMRLDATKGGTVVRVRVPT